MLQPRSHRGGEPREADLRCIFSCNFQNFTGERDECAAVGDRFNPPGYFCSVSNIVEKATPILQKVVRGSWADLDMLEGQCSARIELVCKPVRDDTDVRFAV